MDPEWVYLFLIGAGTGVFGAMVGTGGGVVLVPVLLLFFGMDPVMVAGTSLALVALTGASSALMYLRHHLVDKRSGLIFMAAALPGSLAAPFAVERVGGDVFRTLFGAIIAGLAVYLLYRSSRPDTVSSDISSRIRPTVRTRRICADGVTYEYRFNEGLAALFNFFIGFVSAFFGAGGGFLRTPVLVTMFGFPVRIAAATSLFAMSVYATAGAGVHAYLGHVEWLPTFAAVAPGLLIGSPMGVWLARKTKSAWIVVMLAGLLLVMGVRLILQGLA